MARSSTIDGMSAEHFNELIGTVAKTTGISESRIAREILFISKETKNLWKRVGIPEYHKSVSVKHTLKEFMRGRLDR